MNFRNAQYNQFGTIDCEVEHPNLGWIPFTASQTDVGGDGAGIFEAAKDTATEYVAPPPPPEPTPEELLEQARAAAFLSRDQFLLAAVAAGIVTEEVAEEAASGAWPAGFNTFLSDLTASQRITAKATWADGVRVARNNPILALIAADQGITDAQLDALFGIE